MFVGMEALLGKTIIKVIRNNDDEDDYIELICSDGWIYNMRHEQDCCEDVSIESIEGDLYDGT